MFFYFQKVRKFGLRSRPPTYSFMHLSRLVDNVFEEYPPPYPILTAFLDSNSQGTVREISKTLNSLKRSNTTTSNNSLVSNNTNATNTGSKKFKLSFLHRHCILAQIKSLMHMGICFAALGSVTTALQYQCAAHSLMTEICDLVCCREN